MLMSTAKLKRPVVPCSQEAQVVGEYIRRRTALRRYVPLSSHELSDAVSEAQVTIKSVTARIERVCKCNAAQSIVVLSRKNLVHDLELMSLTCSSLCHHL